MTPKKTGASRSPRAPRQQRPEEVVGAARDDHPPDQHENPLPRDTLGQQEEHGRHDHERAVPTNGMNDAMNARPPKTTGERMPVIQNAMPISIPWARAVTSVPKTTALVTSPRCRLRRSFFFGSIGIRRRTRSAHLVAVAEEEEQDEQHQRHVAEDPERSGHPRAAVREEKLEDRLECADRPGLDLRRAHGQRGVEPLQRGANDRQLDEILQRLDLVVLGETRQPLGEIDRLSRERRGDRGDWDAEDQDHGQCHQQGGRHLAAAQAAPEPRSRTGTGGTRSEGPTRSRR